MVKEKRESALSKPHTSGDAWRKGTVRLGETEPADAKKDASDAKTGTGAEKKTVNQRLDGLRDLFIRGDVGGSVAHSERWYRAHEAVKDNVKAHVDVAPEIRRGAKEYEEWRRRIRDIDDIKAKTAAAKTFQASERRVEADKHEVHHFVYSKAAHPEAATDPTKLYPLPRPEANSQRKSVFDESKKSSVHTDLHRATGEEGFTDKGAPALYSKMAILEDLSGETLQSVQNHLEHQSPASQSLKRAMGALKRDAWRRKPR